ncbi:hypothetical protein [Streptomyces arboris]|uniref:hypothetical protein n=1 Tax=Streptomyces arboris TaxID=2600619 RepID=UPI00178C68B7|nr:hypothetical protein [Streptomyces arboris]
MQLRGERWAGGGEAAVGDDEDDIAVMQGVQLGQPVAQGLLTGPVPGPSLLVAVGPPGRDDRCDRCDRCEDDQHPPVRQETSDHTATAARTTAPNTRTGESNCRTRREERPPRRGRGR